jgi:hypothetical protein
MMRSLAFSLSFSIFSLLPAKSFTSPIYALAAVAITVVVLGFVLILFGEIVPWIDWNKDEKRIRFKRLPRR